jgi:16S rRNA (cytosine1402-N4)-methyltransferase
MVSDMNEQVMHKPVLLEAVMTLLQPERGGFFIDGTVGMGGHAAALLDRGAHTLVGIDQDPEALAMAKKGLQPYKGKFTLYFANYADLNRLYQKNGWSPANGILLDVGVSSFQIDTPERGFSFQKEGPLDMRMDPHNTVTAATIVNTWPEPKLADLFWRYGEERLSRKIARLIVERRGKAIFRDTLELSNLLVQAYPPPARHKGIHPATRVFQALRIAVNHELDALEEGILAAFSHLELGGVLAVISFHSLEDRIVKNLFRTQASEEGWSILTKKPITASEEEEKENPRSRSAKLRAIQRPAL